MERVSSGMAELMNICNAAKWHREHCHPNKDEENCNVALYLLGLTAKRLVEYCWLSERNTARRIISETNFS
jgi:hypothetical protein